MKSGATFQRRGGKPIKRGWGQAGKCVKRKSAVKMCKGQGCRYKVTRTAYCPSHDSLQYWNNLPCSATASSCLDGLGNVLPVPSSTFYLQHPFSLSHAVAVGLRFYMFGVFATCHSLYFLSSRPSRLFAAISSEMRTYFMFVLQCMSSYGSNYCHHFYASFSLCHPAHMPQCCIFSLARLRILYNFSSLFQRTVHNW